MSLAPLYGICVLLNKSGERKGVIIFKEIENTKNLLILGQVKGLKKNGLHGIHIHKYGDITRGCASMGGHFNPTNKNHGSFTSKERHLGDLGNLEADQTGSAKILFEDNRLSLRGSNSILGRSVVVHEDEDDLGKGKHADSKTTGHSGARMLCGIIGLTSLENIMEME